MAKPQHSTYTTALPVEEIKKVLATVLSGATIEPLNVSPLDGPAALAILATQRGGLVKRSPFGPGTAVAQVIVEDHGSTRQVELIAMALTFTQSLNNQRAAGNAMAGLASAAQSPNPKAGRTMVAALEAALRAADPKCHRVH